MTTKRYDKRTNSMISTAWKLNSVAAVIERNIKSLVKLQKRPSLNLVSQSVLPKCDVVAEIIGSQWRVFVHYHKLDMNTKTDLEPCPMCFIKSII